MKVFCWRKGAIALLPPLMMYTILKTQALAVFI